MTFNEKKEDNLCFNNKTADFNFFEEEQEEDVGINEYFEEQEEVNEEDGATPNEETVLGRRLRDRGKLKKPSKFEEFEVNIVGCEPNCYQEAVTGRNSEIGNVQFKKNLMPTRRTRLGPSYQEVKISSLIPNGFSRSILQIRTQSSR